MVYIRCRNWSCSFIKLEGDGKWVDQAPPSGARLLPVYKFCDSCTKKEEKYKESWRWQVRDNYQAED